MFKSYRKMKAMKVTCTRATLLWWAFLIGFVSRFTTMVGMGWQIDPRHSTIIKHVTRTQYITNVPFGKRVGCIRHRGITKILGVELHGCVAKGLVLYGPEIRALYAFGCKVSSFLHIRAHYESTVEMLNAMGCSVGECELDGRYSPLNLINCWFRACDVGSITANAANLRGLRLDSCVINRIDVHELYVYGSQIDTRISSGRVFIGKWEKTTSSIVVEDNLSFSGTTFSQCRLEFPKTDGNRLVFTNCRFYECDLLDPVFADVVFEGCKFDEHTALFRKLASPEPLFIDRTSDEVV